MGVEDHIETGTHGGTRRHRGPGVDEGTTIQAPGLRHYCLEHFPRIHGHIRIGAGRTSPRAHDLDQLGTVSHLCSDAGYDLFFGVGLPAHRPAVPARNSYGCPGRYYASAAGHSGFDAPREGKDDVSRRPGIDERGNSRSQGPRRVIRSPEQQGVIVGF